MPLQTTKTDKYIFPDGVGIAVQPSGESTFYDLGVLAEGTTITHNFDKVELESGNAGKLCSSAKNETMALAPSELWSWDFEALQKASGGLYTYNTVAGTPVAGATQVLLDGAFAYNIGYEIEGKNGNGNTPTINSVTGSIDGVLSINTEYTITKSTGGSWMITIIGSTSLGQDITIDYDYTPAASYELTSGKSSTVLSRSTIRLRHYTDDALTAYDIEVFIYGCDLDAGIAFAFNGANSDTVNGITVAFTGNIDSSQTSGEQLFKMLVTADAYTSC